jgi:protein involved in polysaccharide export with SLBB domain
VIDIIAKAGGVTPWADMKNVYVERDRKKIALDMLDTLSGDTLSGRMPMQDGDVLVIPSVNAAVYVQGQVVNPSSYPYQPNLKASDYIGLAGGPLEDANMSAAYVVRGRKKIAVKKDPVIEQGDRVFVPRQVFKFWQDYVEIGSVVATLLISYLTFQSLNK